MLTTLIAARLLLISAPLGAPGTADAPKHTLNLEVSDPRPRAGNMAPARVGIDFRQVLKSPAARINPATIHLHALDEAGKQVGPEIPVRFDDPDPKPDSFFHAFVGGGGVSGDLVLQHLSDGKPTRQYQLDFELWDDQRGTAPASPAPQIGDFDILRYGEGPMSGIFQTKIAIGDWDGDGTLDIIAGDQLGPATYYRRLGKDPFAFEAPREMQADGKRLKVNWMCTPDVVDWDGDGDLDLITSDETSGMFFLENIGTRTAPKLAAPKPLTDSAGKVIKSPITPVVEMSFFKKDYAPAPVAFDYNGDGKVDLLFGGYITGYIYWYENVSTSPQGPPVLENRGFLSSADGKPIDVTWCAAPHFADLDGDGLPDLVSGHIAEQKDKFDWKAEPSLYFWKNTGTRSKPTWTPAEFGFPKHWTDYPPDVTVPRVVDWNGDGKLDILMSGGCEIFFFENVGTATQPKFEFRRKLTMRSGPLQLCPRFNAISPVLADLDGDNLPDLISGGSGDVPWSHMVSFGNTPVFEDRGFLEADGKRIYHEFIHGDDTTFPYVFDWDADGLPDVLMGDGDGYVTFYRNIGTKTQPKFTNRGRLQLTNSEPLCAGVPTPAHVSDFEGHSGNRSVPAPADYDGDGKIDLICSNADGKVFFYRNAGDGRFAPGIQFATGTNRCFSYPVDWDGDGKADVILAWATGPVIYLNRGMDSNGAPKFDIVKVTNMPWIPIPRALALDWDRDGDTDMLVASSYSLLHFGSRDFVEHGYLTARLVPGGRDAKQ